MVEAEAESPPPGPPLKALISLYGVEAGLIQQKVTHILTIRSIGMATFTAILASVAIYPGRDLQLLSLVLIPFYALDLVYDAYLIPIVRRETVLRHDISLDLRRRGADSDLVAAYDTQVDHRVTPANWSPFWRCALEPVRVVFYASLVVIPIVVVALRGLT